MNWSRKHRPRPWGRYHHGNLKEALVQAARDLVAEFGPSGFSLAEAARRAGVSAAAPYRHFTDRQALMGELARQGFAKLAIGLHEAWNDGQPDPPTAFQRMGAAYVTFATEDPAAFAAMFESGGGPTTEPAMKDAAERTFAILVAAAGRLGARQAGDLPADPRRIALHMWALAHGIASLSRSANGTALIPPDESLRLLSAGTSTYLAGLTARLTAR